MRMPSSFTSRHFAFNNPFLNEIIDPTFIGLAFPHKHSQISPDSFFNNKTSIWAFVSSFSPINLAGKTLVSTASKDDLNLTIVSLNDGDIYNNHENLYENIFSEYHRYEIIDKNDFHISAETSDKNFYLKESFYYPLTEQEVEKIRTVVHFFKQPSSDKTGVINIYLDNEKIGKLFIYTKEKKKEDFSFLRWLKELIWW